MQKDILVGSSLKLWKEQKACPKAKRARNRRDRGRTKEWIMIKNKNGGWLEKGEWLVVVHNILKGTIKRIAFINIIITSRMSLSTNKCVNCQIPVYRMKQYSCCNKNEYICTLCSSHPCDNCKKGRFNTDSPSLFRSSYHRDYSSLIKKCARCSETIYSFYQSFEQPNCKIFFCYTCLYSIYCQFRESLGKVPSKQGPPPSIPVELPCGCSYLESRIVAFLQKVCFSCFKEISSPCYLMNNNARVEKSCFERVQNFGIGIYSTQENTLAFQQIEQLMARCTGCMAYLSEIGGQMEDILFCRECFKQMTVAEQQIQQSKIHLPQPQPQPQPEKPKNKKKKQCSICSRLFPLEAYSLDICQVCASEYLIEQEKQPPEKQRSNQNNQHEGQNGASARKEEEKYSSEIIEECEYEGPINENRQVDDVRKDELELEHSFELLKEEEEPIQKIEGAAPYSILKSYFPQESQAQCSQCLTFFCNEDLLNTYERVKDDKKTIRIVEDRRELSRIENQERTQRYCELCYFELKYSHFEDSKFEEKNKFSSLHSSPARTAQQPHRYLSDKKPNTTNCKQCNEPVEYSYVKNDTCQKCRLNELKKTTTCKSCHKLSKNVSSLGRCEECCKPAKCQECWKGKERRELQNGVCVDCLRKTEEQVCKHCNKSKKDIFLGACSSCTEMLRCKVCKLKQWRYKLINDLCKACARKKEEESQQKREPCQKCRFQKVIFRHSVCKECYDVIKKH